MDYCRFGSAHSFFLRTLKGFHVSSVHISLNYARRDSIYSLVESTARGVLFVRRREEDDDEGLRLVCSTITQREATMKRETRILEPCYSQARLFLGKVKRSSHRISKGECRHASNKHQHYLLIMHKQMFVLNEIYFHDIEHINDQFT